MSSYQIHVFISHSWRYSEHYDTLCEWVFQRPWTANQRHLDFRNYSVPSTDPIIGARNDSQLRSAIYRQIAMSHVIVIPTGMYTHHSKWISKEIEGSKLYRKPVLAVDLWRSQKSASVVLQVSNKAVAWNSKAVVNGIWELYSAG